MSPAYTGNTHDRTRTFPLLKFFFIYCITFPLENGLSRCISAKIFLRRNSICQGYSYEKTRIFTGDPGRNNHQ